MHQGKQADKTVIIGIKVAILVWFMFGVPQTLNEFATFHMCGC